MSERKNRITIIAGGKGGVGKSFLAQNLLTWYQGAGVKIVVFDGDPENNTLTRFTKVARPINMRQRQQMDQCIEVIAAGEASHVLLDSQAATSGVVHAWFKELNVSSIETHLHAHITCVMMITQSLDTLVQTIRWTEQLGKTVQWIAVKNMYLTQDFKKWDTSGLRKKFLEELDGKEISVPALPEFLMTQLESNNLSIAAGMKSDQLSWADRQRLTSYQQELFGQFKNISDALL
jgi:hypothetical protein